MTDREQTLQSNRPYKLSARVTPKDVEKSLRWALKVVGQHDHDSSAHPTGQSFRYRPEVCAGCRVSVLRGLTDKQVLYV